jgi:hypothetical protein
VAGMAPFAQRRVGSARKRVRRVWGSKSRRSSPRGVSVLVDDSHEDAGTYQPAEVEVLHGTGLIRSLRRSLVSGPVWSVPVVILIRGKDVPGMGLVHDQHLIEDLASDGADHPLAVGIHQRAAAQFPTSAAAWRAMGRACSGVTQGRSVWGWWRRRPQRRGGDGGDRSCSVGFDKRVLGLAVGIVG